MPHKLIQSHHVHSHVHGSGSVGAFNARLAVFITHKVGTMWAAYLFALLSIISLPAAVASGDTIIIIAWVSQAFLQLVLLPVIMVGQRVISTAQDARAETDHDTLSALHSINAVQLEILRRLDKQ